MLINNIYIHDIEEQLAWSISRRGLDNVNETNKCNQCIVQIPGTNGCVFAATQYEQQVSDGLLPRHGTKCLGSAQCNGYCC